MNPLAVSLIAAPAIGVLAACSDGTAAPSPTPTPTSAVPASVAEEYEAMSEEISEEGGEQESGGWRVAYIVEPAEMWWEVQKGQQVMRDIAAGETNHIEVLPFDAKTGKLVLNTPIQVSIIDSKGKVVDRQSLAFLSGAFDHYTNNFSVPSKGQYTMHVTIGAPTTALHGEHHAPPTVLAPTALDFKEIELG